MTHIFQFRSSGGFYRARVLFTLLTTLVLMTLSLTQTYAMNIQKVVSDKGIEAWLVEDHTIPLISLQFGFSSGAACDPAGKEGLAYITASSLDEGAGDLPSREFQQREEDLAMKLAFSATLDNFSGNLQTLSVHRDDAFDMLRLALTKPRFEAPDVARMRDATVSKLTMEKNDPDTVAMHRWFKLVFGDHPYGRPAKGTLDSVPTITPDDLRAFVKAAFARNNLKVAVVGDIKPDELKTALDRIFGDLPEKASTPEVPEAVLPKGERTEIISMAIPQSVVNFGLPGMKRNDPDFVAGYVMNYILGGGGFASRLTHEVREKRGLAYSVYTYLYPLKKGGVLLGGVGTENKSVKLSLEVIRAELARMAAGGPTEEELQNAKRYLTGSFALRFDSGAKIAAQLLSNQIEDLGIDYIDKRNGLIEAVTLADVKRVAARLLDSKDFLVVVAGQPAGLTATTN